jgi:hypothetical protein
MVKTIISLFLAYVIIHISIISPWLRSSRARVYNIGRVGWIIQWKSRGSLFWKSLVNEDGNIIIFDNVTANRKLLCKFPTREEVDSIESNEQYPQPLNRVWR